MAALRDDVAPDSSNRQKRLHRGKFCPLRAPISGQANFAELWDCPVAAGGLIKNNLNTNWGPMFSALVVLFRLVAGLVILAASVVCFRQYSRQKHGNYRGDNWFVVFIHIHYIRSTAVFWPDGILIFRKNVFLCPEDPL